MEGGFAVVRRRLRGRPPGGISKKGKEEKPQEQEGKTWADKRGYTRLAEPRSLASLPEGARRET